jgi:Kef-type K+ transport system membrane component KefB
MSPTVQLILLLLILVGVAKLGGAISSSFGQPTVLGKLIAGVLLGPSLLNVMHWSIFENIALESTVHHLSELGVIFLMFIAGLRMEANELREAGRAAIWTAVIGVVVPFFGGFATAYLFGFPVIASIFVGLLLTATSVSISAQTLVELGKLRTRVGTTLMGAAVLDDILGLLLLSIFLATQSSDGSIWTVALTFGRLIFFISAAWFIGRRYLPMLAARIHRWQINEPVLTFAILVILAFSFGAEEIGSLAAITGAFMAGILLGHTEIREEIDRSVSSFTYALLVPIFFISIGLNTDLGALSGEHLPLALVLCAVAIVTKIIGCGIGARIAGLSKRESLQVGAGMVSRGEVGLIVAAIGIQQGIVGTDVFSLTVAVVLATTLITPILLKLSFRATPALPSFHLEHEEERDVLAIG